MLIEGLEKNNVSNYQFFFPMFPKVVLLIDIISSARNIFYYPCQEVFSWNFSQHHFEWTSYKVVKTNCNVGRKRKPLGYIGPLWLVFAASHGSFSLTQGKISRKTGGVRVWFQYCCLLKLLPVQLGKHICPWMLSFWNTMLELFQMVERLRYCYIGVEQCCD